MNKKTILVCDDEPEMEANWKRRLLAVPAISEEFEVRTITPGELISAVGALEERRKESRQSTDPARQFPDDPAAVIDTTGILVIDYDLIDVSKDTYLTGEDVAYLARCYSECGLIVALNQFERGENAFDLTLRGHPESFADLNISDPQLDDPGLWSDDWREFRPWSWPVLPAALERMERRVEHLVSRLDQPIFEYLDLTEDVVMTCPRSTLEFVGPAQVSRTTFRDFVTNSENGLRGKDDVFSELSIMRIAAARVAQWLESIVLPSQDLIVDGPHLVSRYPSLIKGDSEDLGAWNKTATLRSDGNGISLEAIHELRFRFDDWISRPTWFWNKVSSCEAIIEVREPWALTRPNFVFGEDVSRFLDSNQSQEFVADLESPFVRRFVRRIEAIKYKPLVRFSL
jgi:hypothetical protein